MNSKWTRAALARRVDVDVIITVHVCVCVLLSVCMAQSVPVCRVYKLPNLAPTFSSDERTCAPNELNNRQPPPCTYIHVYILYVAYE